MTSTTSASPDARPHTDPLAAGRPYVGPAMLHLFDANPEQVADAVEAAGLPRFRVKQVLDWVYRKTVADWPAMTNLSARDRAALAEHLTLLRGRTLLQQLATDGTRKLLVDWSLTPDAPGVATTANPLGVLGQAEGDPAAQTECVMIPSASRDSGATRRTACISSQIGCPVGCRFCASGLGGLDGNLTAGQIVQQVWMLQRQLVDAGDPKPHVTNVVFMGMGEPLANFPNVARALRTLVAPWGMNLSARKITVSTVGVVPGIRKLAALDIPVTLAISLHAPNDDIRRQIIPWASFTSIAELADAATEYFRRTGREVTLEYILLRNVNDRPEHASELADVAKRLRANINLIRYNEVSSLPYERPGSDDVHHFQAILRSAGINCHIRASRGRDIAAACGQLRHEAAAS